MELTNGAKVTRQTLEDMARVLKKIEDDMKCLSDILGDIQVTFDSREPYLPMSRKELGADCVNIVADCLTDAEDAANVFQFMGDNLASLMEFWSIATVIFRENEVKEGIMEDDIQQTFEAERFMEENSLYGL